MLLKHILTIACLSLFLGTALADEQELPAKKPTHENPKNTEKAANTNKVHFAGVRRPTDKKEEKKSSSKISNEWVKSRTHPKKEKKEVAQTEETKEKKPEELPHLSRATSFRKGSLLAATSLLLQDDDNTPATLEHEPYDAYPHIDTEAERRHVFFTGEWLFWKVRQGGMEFAVNSAFASSATPFNHSTTAKLQFGYSSGFRVGLGVHLPYDGWDTYVNYTDFSPETSKSKEGSLFPMLLYPAGSPTPIIASSAHGSWEIDFQTLDIEIGRAYYIGKSLSFRPHVGMTGAWIDQTALFRYLGGTISAGQTDVIHTRNDFKGAGPRLGVGSHWHLGGGLSLIGNLAASLIAGHFDLKQQQHHNGIETIDLSGNLNLVSPVLQLLAGLAWDSNFSRDQYHFGLSAGFESQCWWRQNQMEHFTNTTTGNFVRADGDLSLYGLTLKAQLDF